MPLFLKAIDPTIDILGNEQVLRYNLDQINNDANLLLLNDLKAIANIFPSINLIFASTTLKGFQFKHGLNSDSVYGDFSLKTYDKFGNSTDIFKYDELTDSFSFFKKVNLTELGFNSDLSLNLNKIIDLGDPILPTDATNKLYVDNTLDTLNNALTSYIDNHKWLSTDITDFNEAVRRSKPTDLSLIDSSFDVNNQKITNLANGVNNKDAVNLQQLNNAIDNLQPTTINLSGAITGNGTNNIDTVLSPFQTMDYNFLNFNWSDNSGISVGPPSIGNKIANENFSQFSFYITDTFFQSHGGDYHNCQLMLDPLPYNKLLGYIFAINYNSLVNLKSKNDIPFAISIYNYNDNYNLYSVDLTARLNLNNFPIINVASPTNNNDAVNKLYADSLITAQLSALSNLSTSGIIARTGTNTFVTRSISVGSGLGISNSDGVSGNPTLSLSTQLQNLHNLNSLGFVSLATTGSGTSTFVNRSLAAGTGINITNGNGVSGNPTINLGTVPINSLSDYPSNNSLFLNGAGSWTTPQLGDITVSANYHLFINNTDTTSTFSDFMFRKNGTNAASFGFNNSTNEGYAWSYSGSSFKIGTNNTKRIDIGVDGTIDCLTNDIITTGTINAKTGTLRANTIGTFDSVALVSEKQINMSNNNIINVATPINNNDAANKLYVDTQSNSIATLIQGSDTTGRRLIAFVHNVTTTISSGTLTQISLPIAYRNSENIILSLTVLNAVDATDNTRAAYGSYSGTKTLSYGMDTTGRYVKFKCTTASIEAGSIITALILGVV